MLEGRREGRGNGCGGDQEGHPRMGRTNTLRFGPLCSVHSPALRFLLFLLFLRLRVLCDSSTAALASVVSLAVGSGESVGLCPLFLCCCAAAAAAASAAARSVALWYSFHMMVMMTATTASDTATSNMATPGVLRGAPDVNDEG